MTREQANEAFVRAFQASRGITSDGWAGKDTYAAAGLPSLPIKGVNSLKTSQRGIDLIHSFESLKLDAYKDPGSKDGLPITIGWGSTRDANGQPIRLGTRWTKEQADAQFARDLEKTEARVRQLAPMTTQGQFDALVSFDYNTGALHSSTLLKKHNAGDYAGAKAEFAKWVFNDGKRMNGLIRRRADEAALYAS